MDIILCIRYEIFGSWQKMLSSIFDATHSFNNQEVKESSGGQREFVEYLARAAVAVGVAGVFIETHQDQITLLLMALT